MVLPALALDANYQQLPIQTQLGNKNYYSIIILFEDIKYNTKVVGKWALVELAETDMVLSNSYVTTEKLVFTVTAGSHFKMGKC